MHVGGWSRRQERILQCSQRGIASTTQAADSAHTVQHGAHNVQQDSHDAQNLAAVIVKSEAGDRGPTLPLAAATAATVAAVVVHNELAVYSLAIVAVAVVLAPPSTMLAAEKRR